MGRKLGDWIRFPSLCFQSILQNGPIQFDLMAVVCLFIHYHIYYLIGFNFHLIILGAIRFNKNKSKINQTNGIGYCEMVYFEFKGHKSSNIGSNGKATTSKYANYGGKYSALSGNHPLNASTSLFASSSKMTNSAENDHNFLLISRHQQQILRRKSSENIHENINGFLRVDTTIGGIQPRRRESFHVPLSNSVSQGAFLPLSPSSSTSSSAYFSDSQTTSLSSTASQTVSTDQLGGKRRSSDKALGIPGIREFSIRLPSFPKSKSRFLRKARQLRKEKEKSCEKERTPTICLVQRREEEKRKEGEKSSDEKEYDDDEDDEDEYEYVEVMDEENEEEKREEDEIEGIEVTVTQYSAFEAEAMPKRLPIPKLHPPMAGNEQNKEWKNEEEEESAEEIEESDEEEDDAYSDKYSNGFLSDRSNRSSMSRSTSVTLCLPLPQSELPPSGAHHHQFHQQFRHSSPIERLVVDEVHFTFRMFNKTDSPKSSPRENVAQNNVGQGCNVVDENRSPRWRGDSHYEAILPGKKEQLQKLQKTPEVIIERSEPIPRTLKTVTANQQKDSTILSPPLLNGNLVNKNEQKALGVATSLPSSSSSFVTAVISSSQQKLPDDEFVISASNKNAESKAVDKIEPPPCYQQTALQKKTIKIGDEDLDLERAYANAIRRSRIAGKLSGMPKFHFPLGKPISKVENDKRLSQIRELFESNKAGQLPMEQFDELCRRMDFAVYIKRAVYDACCRLNGLPVQPVLLASSPVASTGADGQEQQQEHMQAEIEPIDFNQFCVYWNRMISEAHDEASRFVFTLNAASSRYSPTEKTSQSALYLLKEDFLPMMMDLILTHPGLHFLKDAPQFYSKYCEVVIVRIFWNANRSWTGRLTGNELRRSNFLQTLRLLEEVTDINKVTEYFSYEHFYVTYCKFWELDTDHDMVISRDDMRRHCNGALPDRIIDRIFSAAVIRTPAEQRTVANPGPIRQQPIETIGFEDFVCFLLAEEDKRHPTSLEYWFRCVDLDGDGQISLYEMEYFYEGIEQKLIAKNMETLALRDVICNLLDSISPANGYSVTRNDLKRSGLAHRFFNTFVNWIKYVDQESSDGERASVKTAGDKEISDWEVFCLTEYELLMAETEQMSNEGDVEENIDVILDDDDEEALNLSDEGEQRLNSFLQQKQQQQTSKAVID